MFTSDNGPAPLGGIAEAKTHGHDASGGWRGTKFDIYEGGHRVLQAMRKQYEATGRTRQP